MRGFRFSVVGFLVALVAVCLAPAAGADIVYTVNGSKAINVAQDNGSGAHQLIGLSQVAGMTSLSEPAVALSGDPTVMFDAYTSANYYEDTGACGEFGCQTYSGLYQDGLYTFKNGVVTRLSQNPSHCACDSGDATPQPNGKGSFVYDHWGCAGTVAGGTYQCVGTLFDATLNASSDTEEQAECESQDLPLAVSVFQHATPNPVDPSEVAFDGCHASGNDLEVAGANGAGDVVVATSTTNNSFDDPSWRPDGGQLVVYEGASSVSDSPGLYTFSPAGGAGKLILNAPIDPSKTDDGFTEPYTYADPRYIGDNTIMFSTDGNIYTVPASCNGCNFPTDAHLLISGGSQATWTPLTVGATTPPPPPPASLKVTVSLSSSQHVVKQKGLAARVSCNVSCALAAVGGVQIGRKVYTTKSVKKTLSAHAEKTISLSLSKKALKAISKALAHHAKPLAEIDIVAEPADGGHLKKITKTFRFRH